MDKHPLRIHRGLEMGLSFDVRKIRLKRSLE